MQQVIHKETNTRANPFLDIERLPRCNGADFGGVRPKGVIIVGFKISIYNAGPDGTVVVTEMIDKNASKEVFKGFLGAGQTKKDVECQGTGRKVFIWAHNGNFGEAPLVDGGVLTVG
jgi:hypothetical protein